MPELPVTIVLPNGGARRAEMPDDVTVRDLLPELIALLQLPTVGPDGRPMGYRLDSKALGRELGEEETLAKAHIPPEDRLILTADITAGASSVEQSPRMRRLWADYQLMQELAARSDLIEFTAKSARPGRPPATNIFTNKIKGNPSTREKRRLSPWVVPRPVFSSLSGYCIILRPLALKKGSAAKPMPLTAAR
jgi:hypothetical protein